MNIYTKCDDENFNQKVAESQRLETLRARNEAQYDIIELTPENASLPELNKGVYIANVGGADGLTRTFKIEIDDYTNLMYDKNVVQHEMGHIIGKLLFPLNAHYFSTQPTQEGREAGHNDGDEGGVIANDAEDGKFKDIPTKSTIE